MDILGNNIPATMLLVLGVIYIFAQLGAMFIEGLVGRFKVARLRRKHDTPVQVECRRERFEHTNYVYGFGDEIKEKK